MSKIVYGISNMPAIASRPRRIQKIIQNIIINKEIQYLSICHEQQKKVKGPQSPVLIFFL